MISGLHIYHFHHKQEGMGLIEVIVALLLFSSAALGYATLQARAVISMDESVMRQHGLMILNEATERMRANSQLQEVDLYQSLFNATQNIESIDCMQINGCDPEQIAKNDVASLKSQARSLGISMGMVDCPQVTTGVVSKCLIAAWNNTIAGSSVNSSGHGQSVACLNAEGSYIKNAHCLAIKSY